MVEVNLSRAICATLRAVRERRGMSQSDVEKKVGISRHTTSMMENARTMPTIYLIERFCQAYEVSVWKIVRRAERLAGAQPGLFSVGQLAGTKREFAPDAEAR
jgi:transcriptional regulator with XRE-family HTH domain